MQSMKAGCIGFSLLTLLVAAGCGGSGTIPVTGTVTLDGQPLPNAVVAFAPKDGSRPAVGRTDAQGNFQVTTFTENDGVMPGEHIVTVTAFETVYNAKKPSDGSDEGTGGRMDLKWIAPQRYSQASASGLSAAVSRGQTHFVFDLKSE